MLRFLRRKPANEEYTEMFKFWKEYFRMIYGDRLGRTAYLFWLEEI